MEKTRLWISAAEFAARYGISKATAIGLCHDGSIEAVNIARRGATRCRWRISPAAIEKFEEERGNPIPDEPAKTRAGQRTIQRPKKDYFVQTGGAK
jgi:hypothetical protein